MNRSITWTPRSSAAGTSSTCPGKARGRRGHANATDALLEGTPHRWVDFLSRLNSHIAETFAGRNVDDKQIGLWFLRNNQTGRNKALTALRESLRPLINTELQSEWVKVFPGAENYDLGRNLKVASISSAYKSTARTGRKPISTPPVRKDSRKR